MHSFTSKNCITANCQSINFLKPYIHQEINTDPVDLDKFRFVQPLDIANICHDRHNQWLCTFFSQCPLCTANAECWPILDILLRVNALFGLNNPVAHQKRKMSGMANIDVPVKWDLFKDDDKDFAMMWWDSSSP